MSTFFGVHSILRLKHIRENFIFWYEKDKEQNNNHKKRMRHAEEKKMIIIIREFYVNKRWMEMKLFKLVIHIIHITYKQITTTTTNILCIQSQSLTRQELRNRSNFVKVVHFNYFIFEWRDLFKACISSIRLHFAEI